MSEYPAELWGGSVLCRPAILGALEDAHGERA